MSDIKENKEVGFWTALLPVAAVILMLIYGMLVRPKVFDQAKLPMEFIFIFGVVVATVQLLLLKHRWRDILKSATDKIHKAMPTMLILLVIGLLIGSWIVSGIIPMFVYYGIKIIHPDYIYVICFLVPILFSMMTGTSWGSIGTIGVVMIGVAITIGANLPIAAAAIIGGSFFGDKLSPLSDTTNIAALATDVSLYDHIHSMLFTTIPAALLAAVFYLILGFMFPVDQSASSFDSTEVTLDGISNIFNFNILLVIPPLIVLFGSLKRMPALPLLMVSAAVAVLLGMIIQPFGFGDIASSLVTGFDLRTMAGEENSIWFTPLLSDLFSRGGLYSMKMPFIISIFVFAFVGIIGRMNSMTVIVSVLFGWIKGVGGTIRAALISSAVINSLTSNQYANSFIVGDAFKSKFDKLKIKRKVLSRSLEDTGTMIESLVPWHLTAIYCVTTLGVAVADYWYWQIFTLATIVIAFAFTFTGIAIFKEKNDV